MPFRFALLQSWNEASRHPPVIVCAARCHGIDAARHSFAFEEQFGWFETDKNGSSIGQLHLLLLGSDPIGTAVAFNPTTYYGFYMITFDGETWNTLSNKNLTDKGLQHFAIFSTTPGSSRSVFWSGLEDGPFGGDKDYNDVIVSISPTI